MSGHEDEDYDSESQSKQHPFHNFCCIKIVKVSVQSCEHMSVEKVV